jgi:hypothetical protein
MDIKWQRGKFLKFYARMKIRVGGSNPVDIQSGDEFEYDGSILKYGGAEIASPQTRGAVKEGWVTTSADDEGGVSAVSPSRNIANATSVNRDLSKVQRGGVQQLQTDSLDEETVLDVADRRPNTKADPRAQPRVMTRENNHRAGMRVESGAAEQQEGVTVGRVRTAASFKGNVYDAGKAGLKEKLENLTGSGFIPNGKTVQKEGVSIRTNVGSVDRRAQVSQDDDGTVVGKVRHTKPVSEGIEVRDTSNIRNEKKNGGQNGHVQKPAGKAEKIDVSVSPKIRMARRIDPSFPADWSFSGKLAERLSNVKEHGATPTFLEALYAAEGDQMRKALTKAYPRQFGG